MTSDLRNRHITPEELRDATRQRRTLLNRLAHAEAERDRAEVRILQLARQIEALDRVLRGVLTTEPF